MQAAGELYWRPGDSEAMSILVGEAENSSFFSRP